MFELIPSALPGCYEIQPHRFEDSRGRFVKVFHKETLSKFGLETDFPEEYYSVSHAGVIRGMHFQTPPMQVCKMIYCVQGEVFDVVLDLRVGSPTYKQTASFTLSAHKANIIYVPKGLAHGFCAICDNTTLIYKVSAMYAPQHDTGILWNSIDIDWPTSSPLISERDSNLKPLSEFESPFILEP